MFAINAVRCARCAVFGWMVFAAGAPAAAQDFLTPGDRRPRNDWVSAEERVERIVRERAPQMENAARSFLFHIVPERQCIATSCPLLDQLRQRDVNAYWREVAQLAVQFDMFQGVVMRDSMRARVMRTMFGIEFEARVLQRAWRTANDAERRTMRSQLETMMGRHFDLEDELRILEMRDVERRVAEARAESERRRQRKAEMVRWAVEDIIHGAQRPVD